MSLTPKPASLRDHQISALLSFLNLNSPAQASSPSTAQATRSNLPVWKVLVLDSRGQDILATSLRVQDLRDNGVTLHMYVSRSLVWHPLFLVCLSRPAHMDPSIIRAGLADSVLFADTGNCIPIGRLFPTFPQSTLSHQLSRISSG
jgi:hypothetical protein